MKPKIKESKLLTGKHNNVNDKRNSVCNDDQVCRKATKKSLLVMKSLKSCPFQSLISLIKFVRNHCFM